MEYYFSRYRFFSRIRIGIGRQFWRQIKSAKHFYQFLMGFDEFWNLFDKKVLGRWPIIFASKSAADTDTDC